MADIYNKKDVLDVLSELYNNLPSEDYSDLRKPLLNQRMILPIMLIHFQSLTC